MQGKCSKYFIIILSLLIFNNINISVANNYATLDKADSLFEAKKYIQANKLYEQIFANQQTYTPRMLLKMAFINEGLGNYSRALYLLNHYNEFHPDKAVVEKMENIAKEYKLEGYTYDDTEYFLLIFYTYYNKIIALLFLLGIAAFLYVIFKKKKAKGIIRIRGVMVGLYLFLIFYLIHYKPFKKGIVNKKNALVMSAPSAGAKLIAQIDEGNRLKILGKNDIWYKVKWQNQDAYIRESSLEVVNH